MGDSTEPEEIATGDTREDAAAPEPLTIVCVEGSADNRTLIEWLLESTGRYRVVGASDGVAGLELVKSSRPALVLFDLDLPLLSGLDFARRIRSEPELRRIPLVAVSASVMHGERQRSLEAGCMAFLEKPFDVLVLRDVVDDCVRRSSSGPTPA